jgi:hypothetical protein
MAPFAHGLSTHSSLTSLAVAAHQDILDGISDDVTIATGLLTRPGIPRRQTSFSGTSLGQQSLKDPACFDGSRKSSRASRPRRAIQSSNTWTSSSGDMPSEHDEIEDRSLFVDEYNRLAKKVRDR